MAVVRPDINPELLRWARERAGLSISDIVSVRMFRDYEKWEVGAAKPTLRQLEAVARKTHAPLGYFFLSTPPEEELPIPDFRTVEDQPVMRPSPDLLDTVYTIQRRQEWARNYLKEQGAEPLSFIGSTHIGQPYDEVAITMRKALGLEAGWARTSSNWEAALRNLRKAAESIGVFVVINGVVGNNTHRKLDPDEFRGFVLSDPLAPFIFINGADAKAAQMFTIAHELVHLWLGENGVFNLENLQPSSAKVEVFCNGVAAEFLVPRATLRENWARVSAADPYGALARHYKVSPLVIARRALDLSLVSREEFFSFYTRYQERDREKQAKREPGGDFYKTQGTRVGVRFARTVIRAVKNGQLPYRDAYKLTGLKGGTFDKYAEKLGYTL